MSVYIAGETCRRRNVPGRRFAYLGDVFFFFFFSAALQQHLLDDVETRLWANSFLLRGARGAFGWVSSCRPKQSPGDSHPAAALKTGTYLASEMDPSWIPSPCSAASYTI